MDLLSGLFGAVRLEWVVAAVLVMVVVRMAARPMRWVVLAVVAGLLLGVLDGSQVMGLVRLGLDLGALAVRELAGALAPA